ncbi:PPIC-type PPIASE domain-containing protein [Verrucomicrobium sp. GAS474]|uniref:peptidylprolyl isomerase n=1 Tax=Verrucomicrobium sp. GAS474 TaxID=1882831 RepID=UPI00087CAFFA|nr:peptidylprolyl isomerase [Verrucomicrobium sp. GAS474]SDT86799.1 PPIC-type PPIASE domain-containing protein [Verrucomicrobium sp. GAS474]
MLKLIRSQSTILMAILLGIISLSFIVYFNLPTIEGLTREDLGRIGGRTVTRDDFRLAQQDTLLWLTLTQGGTLPPGANSSNEVDRLAWQRMVLSTEATRAGLSVSDAEVTDAIRAFPFLRKDDHYDPASYQLFVKNYLSSRGVTADRFEESVRNDLLINKLTQSIVASASVTPSEVDRVIGIRLGSAHLQVIRLKQADFLAQAAAPTPSEVEDAYKLYQANPAWRTPAKRSIAWAFVPFDAGVEKLAEKEKAASRRKTGETAQSLAEAALSATDKDKTDVHALENAAAAQKINSVGTTPLFARTETPAGLPPSPNLNRAAFGITSDVPVSDPVETEKGYYVLQLLKADSGALLPLDQVRPLIVKALTEQSARKLVMERGQALDVALKTSLLSGKSLADAAKEQKASLETIPAFIPEDVQTGAVTVPEAQTLVPVSFSLQPGEISQFFPTADGGIIVGLVARDPADGKKAATLRPSVVAQQLERRKENIFADWVEALYKSPSYRLPGFLKEQR